MHKAFMIFAVLTLGMTAGIRGADAPGTTGLSADWQPFAPREEIRPRLTVAGRAGRNGGRALKIESRGQAESFGGWRANLAGLTGGRTYRFTAWYRAEGIPNERRSLIARLEWLDAQGKTVRPPDYALDTARAGKWTQVEYVTTVPETTRSVNVQLAMGFAAKGVAWWDDVQVQEIPAPPRRAVRLMTTYLRPRNVKSASEAVEQFCKLVEAKAADRPDLVCLPEGITVVGTGKKYDEVSEPVPGPTTARLGKLARELNSYIVAGLYERDGKVVYNTAVLINRRGELAGKYRKTHLPREEWEAGITPGNDYPVFQTDFGKVGLIICWDLQFPEPARAMAAKGAEVLALPIWGGSEPLARARAIENSIYLISSTYDMKSFVVDPTGQVLAEATKDQPVATTEINLAAQYYQPWLGNMKTRTWKEWRPDLLNK